MSGGEAKYLKIIRLIARVLSAFLLFIVLLFLLGEGVPNPVSLSQKELLLFIAFFLMGAGIIISLRRELYGGVLSIIGYVIFAIINKTIFAGPIFPFFFIVGLLNLIHWWKSGRLT